jgi:hypothetical protein
MDLSDCPYNPPHDQCKAELAAVARALGASPGEDLAHLVALKVQEKRDALVSRDASRERAEKAEGRLAQAQAVVEAAREWDACRNGKRGSRPHFAECDALSAALAAYDREAFR